jgi:hypothetical protein
MESKTYYAVTLTIDPKSTDARNKSSEYIQLRILKWANNLKIKNIIVGEPYYDVGKSGNHHVNLTICCNQSKEQILDKYFKSWINRKGYVYINNLISENDVVKWNSYAKRNSSIIDNILK